MAGGKRYTRKKPSTEHVQTIPELRRAFEHIEQVGADLCKQPKAKAIAAFQQEWKRTFYRELTKSAAEAYLDHVRSEKKTKKTRRLRQGGGADMNMMGAPLDYQTRPGINLVQGGVNDNSYAQVPKYVDSGFWNPEKSFQYDPVAGQTRYVTQVPLGTGTNAYPAAFGMKGGKNGKNGKNGSKRNSGKQLRGGMFSLQQAAMRMFPSSVTPNLGQNAISAWRGQPMGASPDPTQINLPYQMASNARQVPNLAVSPIVVNLKNDLSTN
jgi:hypothetical protein